MVHRRFSNSSQTRKAAECVWFRALGWGISSPDTEKHGGGSSRRATLHTFHRKLFIATDGVPSDRLSRSTDTLPIPIGEP